MRVNNAINNKDQIINKTILLCGCKDIASEFIRRHKNELSIVGFYDLPDTLNRTKWSSIHPVKQSQKLNGAYNLHFIEDFQSIKNYVWVICQNGIYKNVIEEWLVCNNLESNVEFTYSFIIDMLLSTKKKCLLHGYYCYVRDIYHLFLSNSEMVNNFDFYVGIYDEPEECSKFDRYLLQAINLCDYYICNNDIENKRRFTKNEINPKIKIITFPAFYFGGLFPQSGNSRDMYMNEYYLALIDGENSAFRYADHELNNLVTSGFTDEQIVEIVKDINYFDKEKVIKFFNTALRRLYLYESTCNIKVAQYIERTFQYKKLICSNDHWSGNLLLEVVRQIALSLGMSNTFGGLDGIVLPKRYQDIPVYPSVAKALGLSWVKSDTLYNVRFRTGEKSVVFEEYTLRYCRYIRQVQELKKVW